MVKRFVCFAVYYSGLGFLLNRMCSSFTGGRVRILYAHGVVRSDAAHYPVLKHLEVMNCEEFERNVRFMKRHCSVLSLDRALELLREGTAPRNAVVLTFDDGYRNNHFNVLPILRKHGVPATFYLSAGFMDDREEFWFNALIDSVCRSKSEELRVGGRAYRLKTPADKARAIQAVALFVKVIPEAEKKKVLDEIEAAIFPRRDIENSVLRMMSWREVGELAASDLVTLGSHTVTHPILTRIPEEEAQRQISDCREIIREKTGREVRHFAYPNGKPWDINEFLRGCVVDAGYVSASTTETGTNAPGADPFHLRREGLENEPGYMFGLRMLGFFDLTDGLRAALSPSAAARAAKRLFFAAVPKSLVTRRAPSGSRVYLTFDDGPHPERTDKILDILREHRVKAAFFMTGTQVEKYPKIARRVVAEGHDAASHNWTHERYPHWDYSNLARDIRRAEKSLRDVCGADSPYYRPPYGRLTVPLLLEAFRRGRRIVLWSLDSNDDAAKSPSEIVSRLRAAAPGDIVLCHDDNGALVEALPAAIRDVRRKGLDFGRLSEILSAGPR